MPVLTAQKRTRCEGKHTGFLSPNFVVYKASACEKYNSNFIVLQLKYKSFKPLLLFHHTPRKVHAGTRPWWQKMRVCPIFMSSCGDCVSRTVASLHMQFWKHSSFVKRACYQRTNLSETSVKRQDGFRFLKNFSKDNIEIDWHIVFKLWLKINCETYVRLGSCHSALTRTAAQV